MSTENTYSAFRCNDSIVVFHQLAQGSPQALLIFCEPKRLALNGNKLIALYSSSIEAEIILDDPKHVAAEVLNAIALQLREHSKSVLKRRMNTLASAVAGALLASAVWYMAAGDTPDVGQSDIHAAFTKPSMQVTPPPVRTESLSNITGEEHIKTTASVAGSGSFSHAAEVEAQNMQNILDRSRSALPDSPSEALRPSAPVSASPAPATAPVAIKSAALSEETATSARQQMASILKRSADRGMFTISLSTGHERTLYAFLDPTCAVCRSMEPAIEQLAQQYNVVIFPVSVVNDGGNAVEKIIPLLCQKEPAIRADGWRELFRADAGMPVPGNQETLPADAECATSAAAVVAVNNTGFRKFGFAGTPTVLTDSGFRLATGLLADPAKIDHFLQITDQMTPDQADRFVSSLSAQE